MVPGGEKLHSVCFSFRLSDMQHSTNIKPLKLDCDMIVEAAIQIYIFIDYLQPNCHCTGNRHNSFFFFLPVSRCRDNERSGENEVFSGREDEPSSPGPPSRPPSTSSAKEPLKVMPAPPPKENAWAKRSAASTGSNEGEGRPPVSPSGSAPPKLRWEFS